MGSPCYESPCKSGKAPWRSFCDGKAGEGPPSLRTLAPETRAQSGGEKSIFCLVKRMPASPDIRPSSLDSVQVGLGAGTKAASHLPDPDLIYRSSLEMKTKAQRGLGAGPRSHSTGVMWPLQTPRPPDLRPLHTLTSEMKEGRSASWCKPLGCLDNPERPSAVPGAVLHSIECRSSTTSQADFQVSHVISQTVCFFTGKWGQW